MTPPELPGLLMEAHAFTVSDHSGPRLVVAREGATWTVYDSQGTILRDGVTDKRLPEVVGALLNPSPQE